jgi:hypothetical protein
VGRCDGPDGAPGDLARALLNEYVNEDGIYQFRSHYWMGARPMAGAAVKADQVLTVPQITAEEKTRVKAAVALFANIIWDEDFVPLGGAAWVNLGNENMPVAEAGFRNFLAMQLAEHPTMRPHADDVQRESLARLHQIVNDCGAEIGGTNYIGASFMPTLNVMMAIQQQGRLDPFKTEPRLARFAEFYMNLLTPPEVRFGGPRLFISTGDGPTQSSAIYGQLATGFVKVNPDLSARTMWAWRQGGSKHTNDGGTTLLRIDENLPANDPQLGNADFPGYCSVLRHGWDTPNETTLWLLNGDFYRDHRHWDRGSVIAYALGVPLSLDWGSQYGPTVNGGIMHSQVVLEPVLGQPWDQDVKDLTGGRTWDSSIADGFAPFRASAFAAARMTTGKTTWTRTLASIHPNEAYPILLLRDTFAGEQAARPKIFTLNLMADGPVQTPAGIMTPPLRTWGDGYNNKIVHEYPSAGPVFTLQPGVHRLGFTGAQFGTKDKPAIGIDFDLYTLSDESQQAHLGNWADNWVGGLYNTFQQVNGRPYEERQHILRMRGAGPFTTLIVPWRKGQRRETTVTRDAALIVVTAGDERYTIGDDYYSFTQGAKRGLTLFRVQKAAAEGITAEGGPVEVLLDGQSVTITVSGTAGARTVRLPGDWKANDASAPANLVKGAWQIDYAGGAPLTLTLTK